MTTVEVLRKARENVERGWIQGELARNAAGCVVSPWGTEATCFCASGAVAAAIAELAGVKEQGYTMLTAPFGLEEAYGDVLLELESHLGDEWGPGDVADFNDEIAKSKEDVLALFDAVLAKEPS